MIKLIRLFVWWLLGRKVKLYLTLDDYLADMQADLVKVGNRRALKAFDLLHTTKNSRGKRRIAWKHPYRFHGIN